MKITQAEFTTVRETGLAELGETETGLFFLVDRSNCFPASTPQGSGNSSRLLQTTAAPSAHSAELLPIYLRIIPVVRERR